MNFEKVLVILIVVIFPMIDPVVSVTITFEEPIPEPTTITSQYSINPNNFGVYFIKPCRIFEPNIPGIIDPTSSPTHAIINEYSGVEFASADKIEIRFTTGQSMVSVQAGLIKSYPNGVLAHLRAYSSDKPGDSPMLDSDTVHLGTGPTKITHELEVSSSTGNIKSVEIEFFEQGYPGKYVYEVIDDLTFTNIGPPSITDTSPPIVEIIKPVEGQQFYNPYDAEMEYIVKDSESGVARIQVVYLDGNGKVIQSGDIVGGTSPPCGGNLFPATESHWGYSTTLPDGVKTIQINAWDYAGHTGQAERNINLIKPGPFNLWAQGIEITQGTQPGVAVNLKSHSTGSPPEFIYNHISYVPLVAGRTTVVRVYPGLEGTTNNVPLDKVRAQLRCFSDPSYSTPCPGPQVIEAENIPQRNILKELTVTPGLTVDTMRRDEKQSWNFMLPEEWTVPGTIYLEAYVQAPAGLDECAGCRDSSNTIRLHGIKFESVPNFNDLILFVSCDRVDVKKSGQTFRPTQQQISDAINYAGKRLPIDETTLPTQVAAWSWIDEIGDCEDAKNDLGTYAASTPGQRKAVFALGDSQFPCAGLGGGGNAVGLTPDSVDEELGHAVGLLHAGNPPGHWFCPQNDGVCSKDKADGCCSECSKLNEKGEKQFCCCDTDWPWPHGTIGAFGFDTQTLEVFPPDFDDGNDQDPHDFMSYGGKVDWDWVSPRTWIRMYNVFTGNSLSWPKKQN